MISFNIYVQNIYRKNYNCQFNFLISTLYVIFYYCNYYKLNNVQKEMSMWAYILNCKNRKQRQWTKKGAWLWNFKVLSDVLLPATAHLPGFPKQYQRIGTKR